jgi:ComF family protein
MRVGVVGRWFDPLLGLIYPAVCPVCDRRPAAPDPRPFCPPCWADLPRIRPPVCDGCGRPYPGLGPGERCAACEGPGRALSFVRAATVYRGGIRPAVQALKYGRRPALARPLGTLLAEQGRRLSPGWPGLGPAAVDPVGDLEAPILVPVPLHPARLADRGYNQAALLAETCGEVLGLPVWPEALRRARPTRPQTELDGPARRANVAGAFAVPRPGRVAGRRLVLVDDVVTTGATLTAAAQALRAAGAAAVGALVLARADQATPI